MSTRAIQFLKQKKIPFESITYHHEEKGAAFAAGATGFALEKTIKTLVVDLGRKQYVLVLVPGDRQLSMKRLASFWRTKRAAMVDVPTAERVTGYRVGGISPFGTRRHLPVVMDQSILYLDRVLINAGQRGHMLLMAPADIRDALACEVADVGNL
jgi:Cys-tRNA(Pro)/Cys-tRNA(Cys) deacylase